MQLYDILRPHLDRHITRFRRPLSVEQQVAICIWRLATNLEFRSISHLFGIGLSTVCMVTKHVTSVIVSHCSKCISKHLLKMNSRSSFKVFVTIGVSHNVVGLLMVPTLVFYVHPNKVLGHQRRLARQSSRCQGVWKFITLPEGPQWYTVP